MTSGEKRDGMPTWAKVLIALVVVVVVGGISLVVGGVFWMQRTMKEAQDPAAIARVAQSIAVFQDPLPAGFKFTFGLDIAGIKTLTVEHQDDMQRLILMSFPKKEKTDPQELVNALFEKGINTPQANAKFEAVESKGVETVAGARMPYMIGSMTDKAGSKFEGFVACLVSQSREETVFIYGIQPPGAAYNLAGTRLFLQSMKKI